MPASIIFDQVTKSAGVAGDAREDFDTGLLVTCSNSTAESSYTWTLEDVPIRSALVRGTVGTNPTLTFTPDVKGSYRVSLRVNGSSSPADNDVSFCAVVTTGAKTLGWRYPAAGEANQEDNIVKTGLGFPSNINTRGWATERDLQLEQAEIAAHGVINAVVTSPGAGTDDLVKLDSTTGMLDPSVVSASSTASFTYAHNATRDTASPLELIIGGGTFDGSISIPTQVAFNLVGFFTATGTVGNCILRLYDVGAPGTPTAPNLRSALTLPFASAGATRSLTNVLTVVSTLTATDQILNSLRMYEVTAELSGADGLNDVFNTWRASIEVA